MGKRSSLPVVYLTANKVRLLALSGFIDFITDAPRTDGQPVKHTQREIHGRDAKDKKCAGNHANACSQ